MMTTREDAIKYCLKFPNVYEDRPFHDDNWTLIRHNGNDKTFAFIFKRGDHMWINVKAEPLSTELWKEVYASVRPAYHMNKQHWISIVLDGKMSEIDICNLITDSYELTKPNPPKRKSM